MTDQTVTPAAPLENVGRGAAFALLSIPAAIIIFAVVAGVFQIISGIAAVVIPYIASWLYKKGAGGPLTRAGWAPFIGISAAAIVLGTLTGIIAATYAGYLGNGGPFSAAFLRTLSSQFTTNLGDNVLPLLIGLGLGAVGIIGVVRGPRTRPGTQPAPDQSTAAPTGTAVPASTAAPASTAPDAAAPARVAPPIPPAPNQPSPGVLLNGKPIDPNQK